MLEVESEGQHELMGRTGGPVLHHRRKRRIGVRLAMRLGWATVTVFIFLACLSTVAQDCSRPALRGSFLQPALGDAWTLRQWRNEFHYMRKAGLDQMVIQWTADSKEKTTIYPSGVAGYTQNTQHDVVDRALDAADASGAQIYLGLQINDDRWTIYLTDRSWLNNEAKLANVLADDLWKRYRRHKSLTGWYLGFEVDNTATTSAEWDNLVTFYRTVGNHLHKLTPDKPTLISPFFSTTADLSPSQWQTMWEYVLKRSPIDVLALQDGVGVAHATKKQLPDWFSAVGNAIQNSRPQMQFWADTETFNLDSAPQPIRSILNDMGAVRPYVSSYLSFSFNHYLSPQQVNPLYYETYLNYLATGKVEAVRPTKPTDLDSVAVDSTRIRLTWTASTDNMGVVGYKVRRDGKQVTTLYDAATIYVDSGLDSSTTYTYVLRAFDAAGNESAVSNPTTATTPEPHLYPTNISQDKPYAVTIPADSSYPDTGGVELTDGILDSTNYADPAWQGRATTKVYSFTIDLGVTQVIKEIRSQWLQDKPSGIFLPKQLTCLVSDDNVNFTAVGTVNRPSPGDENLSSWYTLTDLTGVAGRYVQIQVKPGWDAGWTFLDEIEVRH
jgi:chitodextrinase